MKIRRSNDLRAGRLGVLRRSTFNWCRSAITSPSPGGNHTTSPARISSIGPPACCTRPAPAVTISVWPSGCVCQAVRATGSNVRRYASDHRPCPTLPSARAFSTSSEGIAPQVLPSTCRAPVLSNRLDFSGTSSIAVSVAEALKRRPS
jgi:hypothetical protein